MFCREPSREGEEEVGRHVTDIDTNATFRHRKKKTPHSHHCAPLISSFSYGVTGMASWVYNLPGRLTTVILLTTRCASCGLCRLPSLSL